MLDRLRDFINDKLGRSEPWAPQPTTVDHGHVSEAEIDRLRAKIVSDPVPRIEDHAIRTESFGTGVGTVPAEKIVTGTHPTDGLHVSAGPIPEGTVLKNRFHIPNPTDTILGWCRRIKNDRTEITILRHLRDDEMVELEDEVEAWGSLPPGQRNTDRVIAEAMDAVACLVDLIHYVKPDVTLEELDRISTTLCARWAIKYSSSAGKPEGEDAKARRSR